MRSKKNRKLSLLWSTMILFGLIWGNSTQVFAQMSIAHIQITDVYYSEFPVVKVRAIVRDGNNKPVPISDLDELDLLEDNQSVTQDESYHFSYEQVTTGVEIMYVVDSGNISSPGASGKTRLVEMQNLIQSYVGAMQGEDSAGLISVVLSQSTFLQPLTSSSSDITQAINRIQTATDPSSNGLLGVSEALSELSKSSVRDDHIQGIIFLTSGVGDTRSKQTVIDRAQTLGIPIHTVLFRSDTPDIFVNPLKEVASKTGGIYAHYTGSTAVRSISSWIEDQRTQTLFSFRSKIDSISERTLIIRSKAASGQTSNSYTYQVKLEKPVVVINSPEPNSSILRRAETHDADLYSIEKTNIPVSAVFNWPDSYKRVVIQAQLLVNGQLTGSPVGYPGEMINFSWDLRTYQAMGTNSAQVQVQIVDELGFSAISEPVLVNIIVEIPPPPPTSTPLPAITSTPVIIIEKRDVIPCENATGLQYWICQANIYAGLISLGVAALSLFLVIIFRGKIAGAAVQVGEAVRDTVARITRPPQVQVGAYLTVVRGAEGLPRNQFPIYINTVTPIGRDRRQAEIVLDENTERSVISRLHCEIIESAGNFKIKDLGSSHGTYVNGQRVPELETVELHDNDQIEIGPVERGGVLLLFQNAADAEGYDSSLDSESDLESRETKVMFPPEDLADRETKIM